MRSLVLWNEALDEAVWVVAVVVVEVKLLNKMAPGVLYRVIYESW